MPSPSEWHHLESPEARPDPCPQRTSGLDATRQQMSQWFHHSSIVQRPLAWDVTVPDTYAEAHVANSARQAGAAANLAANAKQQGDQIQPVDQDPCVLSGGHWNGVYLAPPGDRTGQGDWKHTTSITGDPKDTAVSVSAAVHGTSKGKRGFFSKYLHCQRVCCNPLFSLLLNVRVFCLAVCQVGLKNNFKIIIHFVRHCDVAIVTTRMPYNIYWSWFVKQLFWSESESGSSQCCCSQALCFGFVVVECLCIVSSSSR